MRCGYPGLLLGEDLDEIPPVIAFRLYSASVRSHCYVCRNKLFIILHIEREPVRLGH